MNRKDLEDLIHFARYENLMQSPIEEVISLYDKEMKEYFEDCEADYWIGQNDLC